MIDKDKGEKILQDVIRKKKEHKHYHHVVEYAARMRRIITGVGLDQELKQFVMREDDELFRQRVALTQLVTPSICNTLITPAKKIPRVKAIIDDININAKQPRTRSAGTSIAATDTEAKAIEKIRKGMAAYYGGEGVDRFMEDRVLPLMYLDPNAWILTTFDDFDNRYEVAKPYPTIITSEDAIDFEIANNETQWLVIRKKINYSTTKEVQRAANAMGSGTEPERVVTTQEGFLYQIYLDNDVIEYVQVDQDLHKGNDGSFAELPDFFSMKREGIRQSLYKFDANHVFLVNYYEPKAGVVQAKRVGAILDEATDGATCVSPIQPAMPYLMKSIKAVSELDITIPLHVFLQKIAYQPACRGVNNIISCNQGKTPQGDTCTVCNGTGWQIHKSAQDAIYLQLPDNPEDAFELNKIISYVDLPIHIVEFLDKFCDKLEEKCIRSVFSTDNYIKATFSPTATANINNQQSIYDALYPQKTAYEYIRMHITKCIAGLMDVKNAIILFQFPRDFKFRSSTDLLGDLKTASESGAPTYVKQEIIRDIVDVYFIDRPDDKKRLEVKQRFSPFDGKSEAEIAVILNNPFMPLHDKILWSSSARIFTEAERMHPRESDAWFFDMEDNKQVEIVDSIIEDIIAELKAEETVAISFTAGGIPDGVTPQGEEIDTPDQAQLDAQAKLKGTVGGIEGILQIQDKVSEGTTDIEAAVALVMEIYGLDEAKARKIVGIPKPKEEIIAAQTDATGAAGNVPQQ